MNGMNYDCIALVQSVTLILLEDDSFDLLSRRDQFDFHDPTKDAKFENFVDEVLADSYSDIQVFGMSNELINDVISRFPELQNLSSLGIDLKDDLKQMYSFFDQSHPPDSLRPENNLITGK